MTTGLQLPELFLGAGPLNCRVTKSFDGLSVLISIHDVLEWFQVDKDDKHSDWDHWLRQELEGSIEQASDMRNPARTLPFVLEYHKFHGIMAPMGNIKVLECLLRLCVVKSKIAEGLADGVLVLYSKKLAEHHPDLADFLTGSQKRPLDYPQKQLAKRRTTHDPALYPAAQRATDRDEVLKLELLTVALQLYPDLTPAVYASVKNAYGKRAKCFRSFLYGLTEETLARQYPEVVSRIPPREQRRRPLLWTNVAGGGQQYRYLDTERWILERAWHGTHFGTTSRPRATSCADMASAKRAELLAAGLRLGEWTSDACSLVPEFTGDPEE